MTKKEFEKELRALAPEDLISLLLKLFTTNKTFETLFSLVFDSDEAVFSKIQTKFEEELDKTLRPRGFSVKAIKATLEKYKNLAMNTEQRIVLCLLFCQHCINFSDRYENLPGSFEEMLLKAYREALGYANDDKGLYDAYKGKLTELAEGYSLLKPYLSDICEKWEPTTPTGNRPEKQQPITGNKLSSEDVELFYDVWLPLMDFENQRHQVFPNIASFVALRGKNAINPAEAKKVANKVWENPTEEIDIYLASPEAQKLTEEQREILIGWKKAVTDRFIMERHLKDGTILIATDTASVLGQTRRDRSSSDVYLVGGINSSLEDMFPADYCSFPMLIKATLLPFKGRIITDGLIESFNIYMGSGIRRVYKETYMKAKRGRRIITAL